MPLFPTTLSSSRRRGFTLVELMIALLLGLLLAAALIQLFVGNRVTHALNEQLARVQENGRIASELLSRRIRMAGYYGCASDSAVQSILDAPADAFAYALHRPLQGFEALQTGPGDDVYPLTTPDPAPASRASDWDPPLDIDLVGRALPGSDVLAVRNLSAESVMAATSEPPTAAAMHVAQSSGFQSGQVVAAADCRQTTLFQITGVSQDRILHSSSGPVSPGNRTDALGHPYEAGSEVSHLETWAFYVGRSSQPAGGPALFQRRLNNAGALVSEELVEGVENLQILYGIDDTANGSVDEYLTASDLGPAGSSGWDRVIAVRVALLVRSPEEYGTQLDHGTYRLNDLPVTAPGDRRHRQVFATTIGIRNRTP